MTDLTLFYGTMESGKTTKLLQDNYNYRKHGHKVLIIKPLIDLKGGNTVVNRTNEFAPVDILLANDESIFDDKYLPLIKGTEVILVDEAQFLTEKQITNKKNATTSWELWHFFYQEILHFDSDAIRTHDLPLRRRMLYPAELLNHKHIDYITKLK